MKLYVIDSESDGLVEESTKIHVISYTDDGENFTSLFEYDDMREFLEQDAWFVVHNGIRFDTRLFHKHLGVWVEDRIIDTLALSWALNLDWPKHGLEYAGERLGVAKPKILDWHGQTRETYAHRCEEDVKINWLLWKHLSKTLKLLYNDPDSASATDYIKYLNFKMKCAAEAEDQGVRLDMPRVEKNLSELYELEKSRLADLEAVMPKVPVYSERKPPAKPRNKDGMLSAQGLKWLALTEEHGLPFEHDQPIKVIKDYKEPNGGSSPQIKDWLFSLGWEPCTFDYKREDDGSERRIPQVRKDGELAPSVERLIEKEPAIQRLADLTVIQHRIGVFEGFKNSAIEKDGDYYLKAWVNGFTNTLRFKHGKPLVNLPGVDKYKGEEIRGCLTAIDDDHLMCGSDMVSLESTTKRHFMWPIDPDYVEEMSKDGFDEHLDLAERFGSVSKDDLEYYKQEAHGDQRWQRIHKVRKKFKPVNYGSVYGIGAEKLAREMGISVKEAKQMIDTYWERNWAVKELVKPLKVRQINGQKWMLNPVNKFWYSLRYDKDKFSTLNQGTGAYCFDMYCAAARSLGLKMCMQFHDELAAHVENTEHTTALLRKAIKWVNNKLKLNVPLDISMEYGKNYADVH